jgi:hypothetical protein
MQKKEYTNRVFNEEIPEEERKAETENKKEKHVSLRNLKGAAQCICTWP